MRAVFDTSVVIDREPATFGGVTEYAITSITYAELQFGVVAAKTADARVARAARLGAIREAFGAGLPFDDHAAASYGLITDLVLDRGRLPRGRVADLMIAAVAHANGAALITYNVKDFAGLENLVHVMDAA
ncbi:PIN domain-containing protein [Sinomonas sp. ASV322]|uniref:PIN domain-containing protein n=1 Tax=Sinomonas sp. ASV322 TaxID=3041920 RepID=UPI0027DD032E|nr:PIN domain-containing protein [Sinomonas sp. ASV322]MDQ4503558.1 PIN domain-containing protein [Sinomonas sp. ASV322]